MPVVPREGRHLLNAKGGAALDDKYLFVVLVLAILFGASRLPSLGRNFGQGIREFKRGLANAAQDDSGSPTPTSPEDTAAPPADEPHLDHPGG